MKKVLRFLGIGTLLLAGVALADEGKPNMKPGQWQTTMQTEMTGVPVAIPPIVTEQCLTEKDLVPKNEQKGQSCKVSSQKVTGNSVEWATECKDSKGKTVTGTGKVTWAGESYEGWTETNTGAMVIKTKLTGKRLGDCKK